MVDTAGIREGMEVIGSDGEPVGIAGPLRGDGLIVRGAGGERPLPLDWIARVDEHVHLLHGAAVARGRLAGAPSPAPRPSEGRLKGPFVIGAVLLLIAILLLFMGFFYSPRG